MSNLGLKNLSDFSETDVPEAAPYHFGIVVAGMEQGWLPKLYTRGLMEKPGDQRAFRPSKYLCNTRFPGKF